MCFKILPIEFDETGKAHLKEGVRDPYSVTMAEPKGYVRRKEGPGAQLAAPPRLRDWNIDPMTRVAGALAVHTVLDLENRRAVDAHSRAMLFRGYEVILEGRDPRDAIDISSRSCGVCGGVHASCSALNIEMAFGICPPPLGVEVRNLGEVAEMFYDRPLHLGLLAGPDYSTALVSVTNPELVTRAEKTLAPHGAIHGYTTIKDLMDALNPLTGKIYLEALEWTRVGRIMCMLMFGKFPPPVDDRSGRHVDDGHHVDVQRVLRPAREDPRLVQGHLPHLGRPVRLLPGGQSGLRAGGRPADEPRPERHLRQLRVLRRHLRELQRLGRPALGQPRGDHRGQARHHQAHRHQHRHGGVHRALLLRRLDQDRPPAVQDGRPREPAVAVPRVEQDHAPEAGRHQLQGQVHVVHRAPLGPPDG